MGYSLWGCKRDMTERLKHFTSLQRCNHPKWGNLGRKYEAGPEPRSPGCAGSWRRWGWAVRGPDTQPHQQWRVPEGGRGPEKEGSEEDSACWIVRGREWR